MPEAPDAAELHERLRLIALEMHGLEGYADACEDNGKPFEDLREIIRNVRALIPETADPGAFTFGWAVQFAAKSGRTNRFPAETEADARDHLAFMRSFVHPDNAHRYTLARRPIGGWETCDT